MRWHARKRAQHMSAVEERSSHLGKRRRQLSDSAAALLDSETSSDLNPVCAEDYSDACSNGNDDEEQNAARRLQRFFRNVFKPQSMRVLVGNFLGFGISLASARTMACDDLLRRLKDGQLVFAAGKLFRRLSVCCSFGIFDPDVHVFLAAYYVAAHPEAVFDAWGKQEQLLASFALKMLEQLHGGVKDPPVLPKCLGRVLGDYLYWFGDWLDARGKRLHDEFQCRKLQLHNLESRLRWSMSSTFREARGDAPLLWQCMDEHRKHIDRIAPKLEDMYYLSLEEKRAALREARSFNSWCRSTQDRYLCNDELAYELMMDPAYTIKYTKLDTFDEFVARVEDEELEDAVQSMVARVVEDSMWELMRKDLVCTYPSYVRMVGLLQTMQGIAAKIERCLEMEEDRGRCISNAIDITLIRQMVSEDAFDTASWLCLIGGIAQVCVSHMYMWQ